MTTTIRLRGPADIISVLPYHLGYRPADSLVLVCLVGMRIGVVGRIDLPPPGMDPWLLVEELLPLVEREHPDRVVIVAFESQEGGSEPASRVMRDALTDVGIDVSERLLVRDDRWWSLDCTAGCCPTDGEPLLGDEEVPAVSDYIVLGRRPAATRSALAERLAHVDDEGQDTRCAVLIHELHAAQRSRRVLHRRRRTALRHWGRILGGYGGERPRLTEVTPSDPVSGAPADPGSDVVARLLEPDGGGDLFGAAGLPDPDDEAWAWTVVSLLDIPVRDLLIAWLCPGTLDLGVFPVALRRLAEAELPAQPSRAQDDAVGEAVDREATVEFAEEFAAAFGEEPRAGDDLVEALAMVCRRSPPELSAGPLTVLAHVAWWLGDGALARTAVERALDVEPGYRLAALLERMVDVAARPQRSA